MEKHNFYNCCGAVEIGNFGWQGADLEDTALKGLLQEALNQNKGYAICTTVPSQTEAVKRLKLARFEVLAKFRNPNTGNQVTMWGRETKVPREPKASSR
jgi:hypothetical protein